MSVSVFYLVSGHTIIAQERDGVLYSPEQVELVFRQGPDGNPTVSLVNSPFGGLLSLHGAQDYTVAPEHIIAKRPCTAQEEKAYRQWTSSIQLV